MKQGKHYTTVILWIFIAAIAAYFGYNVVSSLTEPLTTASVIEYEAGALMTTTITQYEPGAGYYATRFVVRDEELIESDYGTTVLACAEGAHVSANEAVATGYLTDGAQQRQTRIQTLQEQLTQLQYAYSASSSLADQAALDEEISSDLLSLAKFTARRDMNSAQDLSPELKGLVLRRLTNDTDSETIHTQLETIQDELTRLQAQAATDTRAITADHAGTYSGVADYMKNSVEKARADGYVETVFHRPRYLPDIHSKKPALRSFSERVAMNMPIQGTAADIIKLAMIHVYRRLKEEGLASRLILQVHDELIVEAPLEEADRAAAIVREEMEGAVKLAVEMKADVHQGKTWYDAKG